MSSPSKKQIVADCSNLLDHAGLLELILELVGFGEALFIRCVDSNWKACYDKLISDQQADEEEHLHTSSCTSYQAVFASAYRVKVAHDSGLLLAADDSPLQFYAGKYAASNTLSAARKLGLTFSPDLMHGAASCKCLTKLKWLHTEQHCPLPDEIDVQAARAGDVEMLRWLKSRGCLFNEQTSRSGAETPDNLHVLQYLYEQGCPWHDRICGTAGEAGDLEQLKWLHAHGAILDDFAVDVTAGGGALHVLEWMQQQGLVFTETTMTFAAMHGHLQLCQWLRAQQCPWDGSAATTAAFGNYSDVLRWLIESGCPHHAFGEHVCTSAVRGFGHGDFSTLQCLCDCGIMAEPAVLTDALNVAGAHNKLAVAQWLRQRGAQWPAVLCCPTLRGSTAWRGDSLAWARAEGCASPTE
eukprot:16755-Heterococcus_DN1.PRE.3